MYEEKLLVNGIKLYFESAEQQAADLITGAVERTAGLIQEYLELPVPFGLRVYVMTSWMNFVFHASPWGWKTLNALTFPVLYPRAQRVWKISNGWSLPYKRRPAVGIKPPRLHLLGDRKRYENFFMIEKNIDDDVMHTTCHELVHAFTTHLRLPGWLNEGLAVRMTDHFAGNPMIKDASLQIMKESIKKPELSNYRSLSTQDMDTLRYIYIRSYWIVRFIDETRPDLLKRLFGSSKPATDYEAEIASGIGLTKQSFWNEVDQTITSHYI